MSMTLTLLDQTGSPYASDETLELLGDGRVLASGAVDGEGRVRFDVDTAGTQRLAVRAARVAK